MPARKKPPTKRPCGNPATGKSTAQSLKFSRHVHPEGRPPWSPRTIRAWIKKHPKYTASHIERTANEYAVSQFPARSSGRGKCDYRSAPFGRGTGIRAVLEFPTARRASKHVESEVEKRVARSASKKR